jgi:hypothetical protein
MGIQDRGRLVSFGTLRLREGRLKQANQHDEHSFPVTPSGLLKANHQTQK